MKIPIDIDKNDYDDIQKTVMSIDEMYNTTQGRVYRSIIKGAKLAKDDILDILPEIKELEAHRKLLEYIKQKYNKESEERRAYYSDGDFRPISIHDGSYYILNKILEKWEELEKE